MNQAIPQPLDLKSIWTGAGLWAWGHAVVVVALIAVLVAVIVLQGAVRSPNRKALRALHVALAPMLALFVVVVVQRFSELSY